MLVEKEKKKIMPFLAFEKRGVTSFKISHNLESSRKPKTFFTNQLDHASDSPQAVSNVIDQMYNLYPNDPILTLQ